MQKLRNIKAKIATLAVLGSSAFMAQAVPADPSDIVTDASTLFDTVSVLVVAMVAFYILVRVVKGIRK